MSAVCELPTLVARRALSPAGQTDSGLIEKVLGSAGGQRECA